MFDLANDRLNYGELLQPDVGFSLDFAVGATYSLDLDALLGVPVSLGLLNSGDDELMRSPLYVLEAIRSSADRVAIFCDAGGIKLPDKIQSVYSLLEESVFPVKLSGNGHFHPKLWVLKYSDGDGNSYIKLLVLSRNLTFDSSIDLCVAMRGNVGRAARKKNAPLADMLTALAHSARGSKKKQVMSLAEDVRYVASFEIEHPFEDYAFLPMGIPEYKDSASELFGQKYDLFAVSPFLSDNIVRALTNTNGQKILVTRKASVTKQVMKSFDRVYITKDVLSDNEFGAKQDIHAKLYFTVTPAGNYLYIGSANASHNAFFRNTECLLRLKYKPNCMGMKRFADDFLPAEGSPYEELTCVPELPQEAPERKLIEDALREGVRALRRATVTQQDKTYSIQVNAADLKTAETVMLAPLQRRDLMSPLQAQTVFDGLLLKELSEFYIVQVQDAAVVVKVDTTGIPKERDQEIYRTVIDSKPKFLTYLSMVLAEDPSEFAAESDALDLIVNGSAEDSASAAIPAVLYEKMLRVFHQDPRRLYGISDMLRRLDPDIVGKEFLDLYEQFEAAGKKVRR